MELLNKVASYFYIGIVPNTLGALFIEPTISRAMKGDWEEFTLKASVIVFNAAIGALKYWEYKKVKRALEQHGWDERLVQPKCFSPCQRHASRQAAKHAGYISEFDYFIIQKGYRWYHFTQNP